MNEGYRDRKGVFHKDGDIWVISVSGYGTFAFVGDEDDCAHMCEGKARWEGGRGRYWRARDGIADNKTAHKTACALLSALRYGNVADQSNYGPSPKKALPPAAANEATPRPDGSAQDQTHNAGLTHGGYDDNG